MSVTKRVPFHVNDNDGCGRRWNEMEEIEGMKSSISPFLIENKIYYC